MNSKGSPRIFIHETLLHVFFPMILHWAIFSMIFLLII